MEHETATTAHAGKPWVDKFGRRRAPFQTFIGVDGTEVHGPAADEAFAARLERVNAHNRQALSRLNARELKRLERWFETREPNESSAPVLDPLPQAPAHTNGRAPREA